MIIPLLGIISTREIDPELLTLLCLMSLEDSPENIYFVSPEDVECIKLNIEYSKPSNIDDIDTFVIVTTDPELTFVSVVSRFGIGEFTVKSIVTNDCTKEGALSIMKNYNLKPCQTKL